MVNENENDIVVRLQQWLLLAAKVDAKKVNDQ
jgi:hypothetical protein